MLMLFLCPKLLLLGLLKRTRRGAFLRGGLGGSDAMILIILSRFDADAPQGACMKAQKDDLFLTFRGASEVLTTFFRASEGRRLVDSRLRTGAVSFDDGED